jgi:kynurenine formamidase
LRLLMVGSVKILNKQIIEEPHKRGSGPEDAPAADDDRELIDLSHIIENGMITYKGLPAPIICDHISHLQSRANYAPGTEFQFGRIDMVGNTGTYIDTPFHRYPEGADLSATPLPAMANLPGVVVCMTGTLSRAIDWMNFAAVDVRRRAVLVNTGWDRHWRTDAYFEGHPFLTKAAAEYLRDQGAVLVGIDSLNIDDTGDPTRPVHSVLLAAGMPIVEHMTNLAALPAGGFSFSAVPPPKIVALGTFPVRAHAVVNTRSFSSGSPQRGTG